MSASLQGKEVWGKRVDDSDAFRVQVEFLSLNLTEELVFLQENSSGRKKSPFEAIQLFQWYLCIFAQGKIIFLVVAISSVS